MSAVPALPPLTFSSALSSWRADPATLVAVLVVAAAYLYLRRRSDVGRGPAAVFLGLGCGVWLLSGISFVGVYSDTLFWVRALQVVMLLMIAPFGLALGKPLTVLAAQPSWGQYVDAALHSRFGRIMTSPPVTSAILLVTPWLIYLTGWYPALLGNSLLDAVTRFWLIIAGFGYFYVRLQIDPVPRRFSPALSLLISAGEAIGDGVLGIVLWQGPLVAAAHYEALNRTWGPSIRTDQTIGAGVLWILGDVVGLPFLLVLFRHFTDDDRRRAKDVDAQLDSTDDADDTEAPPSALWWQNDEQFQQRFKR
ncbi:cytochrome c oxidase assembly protein [Gordonia sp. TBRC 11910]|uniref:Cytochrome c oxidase assembly protein n=1 Tax=Gordonia asplenii TaxID=2725283 RepID=A0A848KVR7_9ACTN|nr:cytochrome c oxidase assembly protein [Gordonia asplenii]NMO00965.1 cytochrome c oxidase assembly protein [Gordonia asplenii]